MKQESSGDDEGLRAELSEPVGDELGADRGTDTLTPIVGIGASAGGLAALEQVFRSIDSQSGAAYVVLQHLAPNFDSHMTDLLGRVTSLPVVQAVDRIELEPDHVYVMQPNTEMIVSGGRLLLTDKDPNNAPSLPIDTFLRSAAREAGAASVAIVLSGTGSDGTRGVKEIKAAGGHVIVQSPDDAEFDGMPTSAIATGVVDYVLDAADIAPKLRRMLDAVPRSSRTGAQGGGSLEEKGFRKILDELARQKNVDFSVYRRTSLTRRIRRRMELRGLRSSEDYARLIASDAGESQRLFHDILIGVTGFFRDPHTFAALRQAVIESLYSDDREELRIWVAGCATGEEVYSLAMLFDETREECEWNGRIRIFATDIHKEALRIAADGVYSRETLRELSPQRLERYFVEHEHGCKVVDRLREMVVFAHHNVVADAPFTQLDLIACRNVLIYLQPATQARILALFHFGLRTGGLLFLGPSETLGKLDEEFDPIDTAAKVFRKQRDLRLATHTRLGRFDQTSRRREVTVSPIPTSARNRQEIELLEALVQRAMPPSFLLDESFRLVHCYGGAEKYLSLKPGRLSTDPLSLLDGRLRTVVASLIDRLKNDPSEQHAVDLPAAVNDAEASLRVVASRLRLRRSGDGPVLIELQEIKTAADGAVATETTDDYLTALERDLEHARVQLQTTVEELEAANEELQATNEELVASNEELQSTNEELRSVNDELSSVNEDHQNKIAELVQVTEDLENLLHTINVAALFVDRDLCVRRANKRAGDLLRVFAQDVGRGLDRLSNFQVGRLIPMIHEAQATGEPVEAEIAGDDSETLLINVIPYESRNRSDGGVVATAVDISSLKAAQAEAGRLSEIVLTARDAIISKDLNGRILTWNHGAQRLYGYSQEEAVGQHISLIVPNERRAEIDRIIGDIGARKEVAPFETMRITKDGDRKHVLLSCAPMFSLDREVNGVSVIALDITDRKRAEERAAIAIEQRDKFLAVLSHELRNPLMAMLSANEILMRSKSPEGTERAKQIIARQVTQMSHLLEDTLDASRMRHDKIELHRSRVNLSDVIEVAVEAAGASAEHHGVSIKMDLPGDAVDVRADSSRLQQVIANLLQNALKYSERGQAVEVSLAVADDEAVIVVRDQGSGIEPSALPHVFEPFYQSEPSKHGGLGLGLSLAKAVTKAHGGEIFARSKGIGRGAEFEVRLPLAASTSDTATDLPRPARARNGSGPFSVVLVDDDEASRESIGLLLRDAGYDVHEASNGSQGLDVIGAVLPSVAVIDIGLPDMSGLDVARKVRRDFSSKQIRLLALTGFGQQRDRENAMEAGFDMHLVKPIDFPTLEKVISYQASR